MFPGVEYAPTYSPLRFANFNTENEKDPILFATRGTGAADLVPERSRAVSVGIIEQTPILDLAYVEDSTADVDMNVVCTGIGHFE